VLPAITVPQEQATVMTADRKKRMLKIGSCLKMRSGFIACMKQIIKGL
jgi:hypothetical protein